MKRVEFPKLKQETEIFRFFFFFHARDFTSVCDAAIELCARVFVLIRAFAWVEDCYCGAAACHVRLLLFCTLRKNYFAYRTNAPAVVYVRDVLRSVFSSAAEGVGERWRRSISEERGRCVFRCI